MNFYYMPPGRDFKIYPVNLFYHKVVRIMLGASHLAKKKNNRETAHVL